MNEKQNPQVKISCKNVWKVFGARPQQAIDLIGDAMTKEQMLEKTGHVVAVKNVSFDVFEGEIFLKPLDFVLAACTMEFNPSIPRPMT